MRVLLGIVLLGFLCFGAAVLYGKSKASKLSVKEKSMEDKIEKTEEEWEKILSPETFRVLRKHGTERAFTGEYDKHKEKGIYVCAGCGNELFHSDAKYDSGSGWPSFYQPISEKNIGTDSDRSFFMIRTEVHCARCRGHLGHVFPDGPKPTGLRYCINSVSLQFKKSE
jgi:peptide-methionine (R)-S-oxide reductase